MCKNSFLAKSSGSQWIKAKKGLSGILSSSAQGKGNFKMFTFRISAVSELLLCYLNHFITSWNKAS